MLGLIDRRSITCQPCPGRRRRDSQSLSLTWPCPLIVPTLGTRCLCRYPSLSREQTLDPCLLPLLLASLESREILCVLRFPTGSHIKQTPVSQVLQLIHCLLHSCILDLERTLTSCSEFTLVKCPSSRDRLMYYRTGNNMLKSFEVLRVMKPRRRWGRGSTGRVESLANHVGTVITLRLLVRWNGISSCACENSFRARRQ